MQQTPYTKTETAFFIVILMLTAVLSFLVFMPFLSTLILAATFAVIVNPFHKKVVLLVRGRQALAASITLFLLVLLIIAPLFIVAGQVFTETTSAYHHLVSEENSITLTITTLQETINDKIAQIFPSVTIDVRSYITSISGWVLQNIGAFFSGTLSIGIRLFLGIFALFYFLKDGKKFIEFMQSRGPLRKEHNDILIKKLRSSIRSIIGGTIVVALAQGVVSGIGFAIFGVPNPALWGTIAGLAALVPGLGTSLILVPATIYLFFAGTVFQGIGMAIWGMVAVGLLDNVLSPKLLGAGMNIHPLVILFSVIGGLTFFGPEGFLLGPLAVSLFIALFDIYHVITNISIQAKEEESAA